MKTIAESELSVRSPQMPKLSSRPVFCSKYTTSSARLRLESIVSTMRVARRCKHNN